MVLVSCSNVNETSVINKINVYPNPTKNILNFEVDLEKNSNIVISLNNIIWNVVLRSSFVKSEKIKDFFSTKELPVGVYYLNIKIDEETSVFKVVKY